MRSLGSTLTLIVMDEDGLQEPKTYRVRPRQALGWAIGASLVVGLFMVLLVVATPIRGLFPGLATEAMREEAETNALRLQSVEDSLAAQDAYLAHLRDLVLGRVEPGEVAPPGLGDLGQLDPEELGSAREMADPPVNRAVEAAERLPVEPLAQTATSTSRGSNVTSIRFPVLPPLAGVFTRGYIAGEGHYAVDFAASEGTLVRSIGDGFVIFADWTHDAGFVIMVQHTDGFVSAYKHNQRLTRRPGDRVSDRETIALSGNTGEFTTGPHLHFELWLNGLALDPREYLVGL